jgi:hypothetical protein
LSLVKLVIPVDRYSKWKEILLHAEEKTCLGLNHQLLLGGDSTTSHIFFSPPTVLLPAVGLLFDPRVGLFRIFQQICSHSPIHANSK